MADDLTGYPPSSSHPVPLLHGTKEEKNRFSVIVIKDGSGNSICARRTEAPEILKCVVCGGLIELTTSLSVVSSAATSDTTTLNTINIGLATLVSGLFIFGKNLMDLKNNASGGNSSQQTDRYQELLGRRGHFPLHATCAMLSFLVFGLIHPMAYGFTFHESNNKDYKILAAAAVSLTCVVVLAIAKAYLKRPEKLSEYIKTILYYVTMVISGSGVACAAEDLVKILMQKLGWFEPGTPPATSSMTNMISATPAWASH